MASNPRCPRSVHQSLFLCALLLSGVVSGAQPVPAGPMLAAHNEVRAGLDLPALSWSEALAANAARWADELALEHGCTMRHANTKQGENLYWASPTLWSDGRREVQAVTPRKVVADWASERVDYDHGRNECRAGKVCGHYTQIVWKGTTEVGCARSLCSDKGQIWVCRYEPAGNWVGERPY